MRLRFGYVAFAMVLLHASSACSVTNPAVPAGELRAPEDVVTVSRPGYVDPPSIIGDPAAVVSGRPKQVVSYAGVPVVQACNLITLAEIRDAGALLVANPFTGPIHRVFFDGQGQAAVPTSEFLLPYETNSCSYVFKGEGTDRLGGVIIRVHQPSYATAAAMTSELRRRYRLVEQIGGVAVHLETKNSLEGGTVWMLQTGKAMAQLLITHTQDNMKRILLTAAARNLAEQVAEPAGPAEFGYDSPTFQVDHAKACQVFGNEEFRAVFSVDASALASEWIATAIGVINFQDNGGPDRGFNFVVNACQRTNPVEDPYRRLRLTVETTTFETDEPAKMQLNVYRKSLIHQRPLTEGIGDEALFADPPKLGKVMLFRQGRVVVRLFAETGQHKFSIEEHIRVLSPVAQAIAARLAAM